MSQSKHEQSKPSSKLATKVGRKLEPQTEEIWLTAEILQGFKFSQPAEFRNPGNFAGCSAPIFLLPFDPFCDFFLNYTFCIVGSSDLFVISLGSKHYISLSQALYKDGSLYAIKLARKLLALLLFFFSLIFSPFSFIFSPTKHPLRMTTQGMLG